MRPKREKPEFDQQVVDLARVTRVTKGGKQMSFRATVVIGDRNGRVGFGVDKGKDVQVAVEKAVNQAKKSIIRVPIVNETLPHMVLAKYKAARVMLKPAPKGSGVIAGSSIRTVLEMAGVPNASSKMLGSTSNKISNIKAVFDALRSFKSIEFRIKSKKPQNNNREKSSAVATLKQSAPVAAESKEVKRPAAARKPRSAAKTE